MVWERGDTDLTSGGDVAGPVIVVGGVGLAGECEPVVVISLGVVCCTSQCGERKPGIGCDSQHDGQCECSGDGHLSGRVGQCDCQLGRKCDQRDQEDGQAAVMGLM